MLTLETTIEKTCLIGLTYFNAEGEMLKQSLLAGKVSSSDAENGIGIELFAKENSEPGRKQFLIPTDLSCWFTAPKGRFNTSVEGVTVTNPDFLVTWDIYQSRRVENDEQMQWWEWKPRIEKPRVEQPSVS